MEDAGVVGVELARNHVCRYEVVVRVVLAKTQKLG